MNFENSDYIIYIDESGDHGLENIDADYPLFVLSFCCFQIENYINNAVPKLQKFKFNSCGLQLADLTARPIGINYLKPSQDNQALMIIQQKIKSKKIFP